MGSIRALYALLFGTFFIYSSVFAESQPNFVIVLLDDLDTVVTGPYYDQVLPTVTQIQKEGVTFENAFVTTPLCCPSRASLLTGKTAHHTGVYTIRGELGGWKAFIPSEPKTLATALYQEGYRTYMSGKYLNGFHIDPEKPFSSAIMGWTEADVLASPKSLRNYQGYDYTLLSWRGGEYRDPENVLEIQNWKSESVETQVYGKNAEDYSSDVIFAKTLEFLKRSKSENDAQPFFAYVNPTCPHLPIPPAPRHLEWTREHWGGKSFPKDRANYYFDDGMRDKPQWLRSTRGLRTLQKGSMGFVFRMIGGESPSQVGLFTGWNEADWFNRMGSLRSCDDGIAQLVQWLKENGEWDRTIFIFTSDNGYNLGAHYLTQKYVPYEESIRVPLIVSGGKNFGVIPGLKRKEWILNTDFMPTLLDFAHQEISEDVDGKSFLPLITQTQEISDWRDEFLIEFKNSKTTEDMRTRMLIKATVMPPSYQAIRAKIWEDEYLYVEWEGLRRSYGHSVREGKILYREALSEHPLPEMELYNISQDPAQLHNLLYRPSPETKDVASQLKSKMKGLLK